MGGNMTEFEPIFNAEEIKEIGTSIIATSPSTQS
jgi:hypothetical protein